LAATEATVRSGIYQNGFKMVGKDMQCIAVPELAGAIEFGESQERMKEIIETALRPHQGTFDVLILACTHYPLVFDVFTEVLGDSVMVFDPAVAVAERAQKLFWPREVGNGTTHFLISRDSVIFRDRVAELWPDGSYAIEVVE